MVLHLKLGLQYTCFDEVTDHFHNCQKSTFQHCLLLRINHCCLFNPRPHTLFPILERTWGLQPPCHFAPNWDRTVGQRPNESLGCSESNGTRVDLFRSYLDPSRSGQRKKDSDLRIYCFSQITFELRKICGIIQAPSCFSPQDASKHILFDLGRSSWKFDLRSK